jgi:hypothetical protein
MQPEQRTTPENQQWHAPETAQGEIFRQTFTTVMVGIIAIAIRELGASTALGAISVWL